MTTSADEACDAVEKMNGCEVEVFDTPNDGLYFHAHSYKLACTHENGWKRTMNVRDVRRNWGR